ncbi:MAG: GIY-YIG nuclease family protein [Burkholderiales bacterium]|nr:GIY-YIG nuclease family protein [Burkholderiales bacterium]
MVGREPWTPSTSWPITIAGRFNIGVTSAFHTRMIQHRDGVFPGFTRRYGLRRLVWFELHDLMTQAIQRERSLKEWRRQWKINLIERDNPRWDDLYPATFERTPVPRQV